MMFPLFIQEAFMTINYMQKNVLVGAGTAKTFWPYKEIKLPEYSNHAWLTNSLSHGGDFCNCFICSNSSFPHSNPMR